MSEKPIVSLSFVLGVLTKARLILIFMGAAVLALIWTDLYTRGLLG